MNAYEFQPGPIHVLRLEEGMDLVDTVTGFATERGIRSAWLSYLGAVSRASLRYYDQVGHAYRDFTIDRHLEVLTGVGNVSLLDGVPFVHTHATFSDEHGNAFGGHVNRGCRVFSLEVNLQELVGDPPVRYHDPATGLNLWCLTPPGAAR